MNNFPYWLTKPMMAGARRFNLDAFLLALEGWRRGLTLRWYHDVPPETDIKLIGFNPVGKIFSLSNDERAHFFYRSRGDLVSSEAVEIAGDKFKTKQLLTANNINTPKGKSFGENSPVDEIVNYAKQLGSPVVLKPTFGSLGKGVFTNLIEKSEIEYAVKFIREELNYVDILIEEYIEGEDIRLYVVEDNVVAATKREPASIIGDGIHTIEQLIELRNGERKKNPQLSTRLVRITDDLQNYLEKQQLTIHSVPENGKRIFLSGKANVSSGGDSININEVPDYVSEQAVKALRALPNIKQGGIDLIYNNKKSSVLEINATAGIVLHILPAIGQPVRIEKSIIDFYFPETINIKGNDKLYFNYKKIKENLVNGLVDNLQVTNASLEPMITMKYIVKGKVQGVSYRRYIQSQASKLNLNGYVKNLKSGHVVIVVGGKNKTVLNKFKEKCYEGSRRAKVEKIIEKEWDRQINVGFEIKK